MTGYYESSREKLLSILAKPLPVEHDDICNSDFFCPWIDLFPNIDGSYTSEFAEVMIETMEAVRDEKGWDLYHKKGFVYEMCLYILSGHGLTECGTSPRTGWPMHRDLWQPLIDKWKAYEAVAWKDPD